MRTIEQTIYSYSDLLLPENSELKEKVLSRNREINVDYDWWEWTYDDAKEIGLKISGFDLDRNRHANGEFILSACEVAMNILNNHGENCGTYKTAFDFMEEWQPIFNDYLDENSVNYESNEFEAELIELENDFLNSLLEDYSIILQNESEYLQSEEYILETIEANGYEFDENGDIV